jgi:hypothetical protein
MISARKKDHLREAISEQQHAIWAHWMEYLFSISVKHPDGSYRILPEEAARWKQQIETPYSALPEESKTSDREQADQILAVLGDEVGEAGELVIDLEQVPEYRKHLVQARQKAQEDFDKTVLSLSAGALGISFAFVKDIIGPGPVVTPFWLMTSWACWAGSSLSILISFYMSHIALDRSIQRIDKGEFIYRPGGFAAILTSILNAVGGISFVLGIGAISLFVYSNLR